VLGGQRGTGSAKRYVLEFTAVALKKMGDNRLPSTSLL
jgi:hypothetical protein